MGSRASMGRQIKEPRDFLIFVLNHNVKVFEHVAGAIQFKPTSKPSTLIAYVVLQPKPHPIFTLCFEPF